MTSLSWTRQAQRDLDAIRAFVAQDSEHYADVVIRNIIEAAGRLEAFPRSGRVVPELDRDDVREVITRPYRIVYRILDESRIHVLAVHHGARRFPEGR